MPRSKKVSQSNQDRLILKVQPRTVFGKKLKKIRKEGLVPGNIYGPGFKSQSVSIPFKDFAQTYKVARETGVVYVKADKDEIPALIKNVQRHPVDDTVLHVDFRKIDLSKKIQTKVPVKVVGQSEAVTQKGGILLTLAHTLLVESLPQDIPQYLEIDLSNLKEIGQEVKVSDLKKSDKYEIKEPQDKVVVSIVEHKEESVTPETVAAPAPEVITAKPEEGEVPPKAPTEPGKPAAKVSVPAESTGGKKPAAEPAAKKAQESPKNPAPQKPQQGGKK